MKHKQRSFTVIELLVVISIIGLLASIILVSVKGAREKAKAAKLLQYSGSIHHALGAYIVGEWTFEGNIDDVSGHNYTSIEPAGWIGFQFNDFSSQLGQAGEFDGWSYIEVEDNTFPEKSPLDVERAITIEVWAKPYDFYDYNIVVAKPGSYELVFDSYGDSIRFTLSWPGGVTVYPPGGFETEKWYHFVGTYNGSKIQIFINGEEAGFQVASGLINVDTGQPLYLGEHPECTAYVLEDCYFEGLLDEIRIYEEGLTSAQIQKLYAEGAKKRGLLVKDY